MLKHVGRSGQYEYYYECFVSVCDSRALCCHTCALQAYLDTELKASLEEIMNADCPSLFTLSLETLTLGSISPNLTDFAIADAGTCTTIGKGSGWESGCVS
jgi:hypothetical protein